MAKSLLSNTCTVAPSCPFGLGVVYCHFLPHLISQMSLTPFSHVFFCHGSSLPPDCLDSHVCSHSLYEIVSPVRGYPQTNIVAHNPHSEVPSSSSRIMDPATARLALKLQLDDVDAILKAHNSTMSEAAAFMSLRTELLRKLQEVNGQCFAYNVLKEENNNVEAFRRLLSEEQQAESK
jgi:hypothetical protein